MNNAEPDACAADRRILYVTTRDVRAPRTGADNRAKHLYEGLERAFAVDLVHFDRSTADGSGTASAPRGPEGPGVAVPYPPSELLALASVQFLLAVLRGVRDEQYDAVVASSLGAVTYGLVAARLAGAAFVFDDHNVEADVARNTSRPRFVVVAALERLACARATLLVVPTTAVAEALAPATGGEVVVVTNGYDAETFAPEGEAAAFDGRTLLFFGNFRYGPNREAVEYLVEDLASRLEAAAPDARILLAGPGHRTIPYRDDLPSCVDRLGFVEDLPTAIRGADLVVVPLRSGSGSRLKIIEALACGTPVVSTPIGAEGWPTDWANLTVVDIEAFADTTLDVLETPAFDPSDRETIAAYSWQAQSRRLVDAVRDVVEDRG